MEIDGLKSTLSTPAKIILKLPLSRNVAMFFGWAAAGAAVVVLLWWINPVRTADDMSLMVLETDETVQTREDAGLQSHTAEVKQPGAAGASPNRSVEELTNPIAYLESGEMSDQDITASVIEAEQPVITEAAQEVEPLPTPVESGQTGRGAHASDSPGSDKAESGQSGSPEVSKPAVMGDQEPIANKQAGMSTDNPGSWVINLVSSPSKAEADRFANKARSKGIQTTQQQVTVNNRQFWRIQITGFSTEEQARSYAGTASENLGLDDVWIMSR